MLSYQRSEGAYSKKQFCPMVARPIQLSLCLWHAPVYLIHRTKSRYLLCSFVPGGKLHLAILSPYEGEPQPPFIESLAHPFVQPSLWNAVQLRQPLARVEMRDLRGSRQFLIITRTVRRQQGSQQVWRHAAQTQAKGVRVTKGSTPVPPYLRSISRAPV